MAKMENGQESFRLRLQDWLAGAHFAWVKKISGAVVDQGLFAGSNFLINILLARWMPPEVYGVFVVAYTWFLLAQNFYDAMLIEPLAIFGSGKYAKVFHVYLGHVYFGHWILSGMVMLMLFIGAYFAYQFDTLAMAWALIGTAIATPFLLLRWLSRQPCYVLSAPHWSAYANFAYLLITVAGIVALYAAGILNDFTSMLAIGLSGGVTSWVLTVFYLKPVFGTKEEPSQGAVLREHFAYGLWSTPSRLLVWIQTNSYYVILPIFMGVTGSATLRATGNFILPMNMTFTALFNILVPSFVRLYEGQGKAALTRRLWKLTWIFFAMTGAYTIVLVVFGQWIVHLAYDGRYDTAVDFWLLLLMGTTTISNGFQTMLDSALRSIGGVRYIFLARIPQAILMLTLGIYLITQFGILGAYIASTIVPIVGIVMLMYYYSRMSEQATIETVLEPNPVE